MSLYDNLRSSQNPSQESLKRYQEALAEYQHMLNQAGTANQTQQSGLTQTITGVLRFSNTSTVSLKLLPEETCVQALVGWRRWSVPMFEEKLFSNNQTIWEPYKALAAKCPISTSGGCQGLSCGCGIYSYKTRKQAESGDNKASQVTHVWGEVWLWGRVIEYTHGFRAQFAYPKAFVDTGGIARKMAMVFGIRTI